jgi:hypothetical protein
LSKTKFINPKEFREKGYLQELNIRFLHPLGLALAIKKAENNIEYIIGIIDCRDDEEGFVFDIYNSDTDRLKQFIERKNFIDSEIDKRKEVRMKLFNSDSEIESLD